MEILILLLPPAFFGLLKALSDASFFELPNQWENKYKKEPESGLLIEAPKKGIYGLYHRLKDLTYQERFPGSATVFVWLTDPFHFFEHWQGWLVSGLSMWLASFYMPFSWWWLLWVYLAFVSINSPALQLGRRYFRKRKKG